MNLKIENEKEYQELKTIIKDAIIFYDQKYSQHINVDHLEVEIFNCLNVAHKWLERMKDLNINSIKENK